MQSGDLTMPFVSAAESPENVRRRCADAFRAAFRDELNGSTPDDWRSVLAHQPPEQPAGLNGFRQRDAA